MSVLDYHRRLRLINTVVKDSKLRYYEHSSVKCPCTDGTTIKMPPFNPMFTEAEEQRWMFSLLHECYHVIGDNKNDFKTIKDKEISMNSELGHVLNIVIDHNIEKKRHGLYEGADKWIKLTYDYHVADRVKGDFYEQLPDSLAAVIAFDTTMRSCWLLSTDYNIRDCLSPDAVKRYDKLVGDDSLVEDYLTTREGGELNYQLALRLFDAQGDDSSEKEQEAQEQAKGEEEGEGTGEGQASGTGQGEDSEEDGDGKERSLQDATAKYDISPHSGEALSAAEMGGNVHLVYEEQDFDARHNYEPMKVEEIVPNNTVSDTYHNPRHIEAMLSTTLSTKVRNVLKVASQSRYQGGKTRGKINKRSLARIPTGYERVWRSKENKDVLDTCVTVLVDSSGSMAGSKYSHATAAAMMMNECLSKLAVPHEIMGFSFNSYKGSSAFMHKKMGEVVDQDLLMSRMLSRDVDMHCNSDGDSINHAHDRLIKNKQKRKILVVLSDGSPAGQAGSPEYTVRVVKEIEQKSPVEIYGIGIEDTNVKRIYSNCQVINDASELEDALLSTIKSFMLK